MRLQSLTLQNFRSYSALRLNFDPSKKLVVFAGPNTAGKTNLLESIYALGTGESFRAENTRELFKWEQNDLSLTGQLENGVLLRTNWINTPYPRKKFFLNQVPKTPAQYTGTLKVVTFAPNDVELIGESPDQKRQLLDNLLKQTSSAYRRALPEYQKILRHRNALLKKNKGERFCYTDKSPYHATRRCMANPLYQGGFAGGNLDLRVPPKAGRQSEDDKRESQNSPFNNGNTRSISPLIKGGLRGVSDLDIWDAQLSPLGYFIQQARQELLEFFNQQLPSFYQSLSSTSASLQLQFEPSVNLADADHLRKILAERREIDFWQGQTTKGPHRDNFHFLLNNKKATAYASRGDWRSIVLALKLAELEFIQARTNDTPILLLDDVFSELDKHRQQFLLKTVSNRQAFITTTDEKILNEQTAQIIRIDQLKH